MLPAGDEGAHLQRLSPGEKLVPAAVPDIIGGDVAQRLMVALAVVVVHEAADRRPQFIRTGVHDQRHLVLHGAVHPLDLAGSLGVMGALRYQRLPVLEGECAGAPQTRWTTRKMGATATTTIPQRPSIVTVVSTPRATSIRPDRGKETNRNTR